MEPVEAIVGLILLLYGMVIAVWLVGVLFLIYLTRYQAVRELFVSLFTSNHLDVTEKTVAVILTPILAILFYQSVLSAVWAETG